MGAPALPGVPPGGRQQAPSPTRGTLPPELPPRTARRRELTAVFMLLAALFLAGVLISHALAPDGSSAFGVVGRGIVYVLLSLVGWTGAVFVPIAPAVHA